MIESIQPKKYDTDTKEVRRLKIINKGLQARIREKDNKIDQLYSELRASRVKIRRMVSNEADPVDICDRAYAILCDMFIVDISRKCRQKDYVTGRQYYYRYLKDNTMLSLEKIAYSLSLHGGIIQDHATVIHALHEFNDFYTIEKQYKKDYDHFCELMNIRQTTLETVTEEMRTELVEKSDI